MKELDDAMKIALMIERAKGIGLRLEERRNRLTLYQSSIAIASTEREPIMSRMLEAKERAYQIAHSQRQTRKAFFH